MKHRNWSVGNEVSIHGLEWPSNGPLAILLHANGLCAESWIVVAEKLTERYRVFALDARGHGGSSSPTPPHAYDWQHFVSDTISVCNQILTETGYSDFALVAGSSLGGIIGAAVAADERQLFRRVVMLDPPALPVERVTQDLEPQKSSIGRNSIADQARSRRSIWPSRDAAAAAYREKPMFKHWHPTAFDAYLRSGFKDRRDGDVELACHPEVEASIFELTGSLNIFERARSVDVPVQLVRALGGYFPAPLFEMLAESFPQCELLSIDGGHLLPVERPDEITALLLS